VTRATFWGLVRDSNGRAGQKDRRVMPLVKTPVRKGMCTRSLGDTEQPSEDAERTSEDAVESMSVEALLRAAKDEVRQMREERAQQQRQQEQLMTALHLRDEELQRLRENRQISLSNNGDTLNVRNIGGSSGERVTLSLNELRDSAGITPAAYVKILGTN